MNPFTAALASFDSGVFIWHNNILGKPTRDSNGEIIPQCCMFTAVQKFEGDLEKLADLFFQAINHVDPPFNPDISARSRLDPIFRWNDKQADFSLVRSVMERGTQLWDNLPG